MTEFELIYKLINTQTVQRADVVTGIGDDCAILSVPEGYSLAVSMDTLVKGVHFPDSASAYCIGYKALAVNLSDLAAAGAIPAWVSLSLTLPVADVDWITEFVRGVFELAERYQVQLIGGDTCSGPLAVTIQAHGFVKKPLLRSTASPGDLIYVSAVLGDAALGLRSYQGDTHIAQSCIKKFNQPEPRIELGLWLAQHATACIDISDGLISDLGHICSQSQCGAEIMLNKIPLSAEFMDYYHNQPDYQTALSFGDDYELCFCVNKNAAKEVEVYSHQSGLALSCIGQISTADSLSFVDQNNKTVTFNEKGFEHFK
ncbi:MAG: thiamine-phosphate kinase [Gammaproteobacteria bacterium]|nr:thiamine-phosphate kinase [Gammaproteobacteria bacterium]